MVAVISENAMTIKALEKENAQHVKAKTRAMLAFDKIRGLQQAMSAVLAEETKRPESKIKKLAGLVARLEKACVGAAPKPVTAKA